MKLNISLTEHRVEKLKEEVKRSFRLRLTDASVNRTSRTTPVAVRRQNADALMVRKSFTVPIVEFNRSVAMKSCESVNQLHE